ncbi:MAG: Na(+)/H(+) antiporter subunit D [Chromatiales bacterium]|nr:Na(+)/H(+) antiporter subunit D [Chromatiales bacterium]
MPTELPPFLPFLLAGMLLPLLVRGPWRTLVLLGVPIYGFWRLLGIEHGEHYAISLIGQQLELYRVDRLSLLFGYLFHIAALVANLFALRIGRDERDTLQQASSQIYIAAALGAVFAGDLISLFVAWECMALASVWLIFARGGERALRAGIRYLAFQISSGLLLLAGAILWFADRGDIAFGHIGTDAPGGWLILAAFGIKSAFPFVHTWLTDAYPEATATGTVFLSAFTTKVAVYALARAFAGTEVLIYIGAVMTCFPIFYAVIENDLRRVLAYSMINQIGFMVVGIGIGTAMAVNGAVAHAFNDVLFKGLLMMSMGAVLFRTGDIRGSELGGLWKTMPKTTGLCIVGAASISAFPLFSGFVSKSLVMVALLDTGHVWVWPALLFASAGVFHHAGIKIPYFAFFAHDSGKRPQEAPGHMLAAMGLAAALCIGIGVYPQALYALLPFEMNYTPYDATHVLAQLQLLFFSAAAFVWLNLRGIYPPELRSTNLDADWLTRRAGLRAYRAGAALASRLNAQLWAMAERLLGSVEFWLRRTHGEGGVIARTWAISHVVLMIVALMGLLLLFSYLHGG